jgi:hypothetical protein
LNDLKGSHRGLPLQARRGRAAAGLKLTQTGEVTNTMDKQQTADSDKRRINWSISLRKFATTVWVIATVIVGPIMLVKLTYWFATRSDIGHPVAAASFWGVVLGIACTFLFGTCIEMKSR